MSDVATTNPSVIKGTKRRNERNILTFYEKIAVIRYYEETNISRNSLAKMFHCCATQIRRILERKHELLQQLATLSEADASIILEEMTRKRRKFEMSAISFILHQWVERCRRTRSKKVITNETLKDTALKMAAILNLPSFRPSYRWLNRFRGKYKYSEQDLGAGSFGNESDMQDGEFSVEDIIIEFKDSLPSFMQKEISAITSSAKVDDVKHAMQMLISNNISANANLNAASSQISNENSSDSIDSDEEILDINEKDLSETLNNNNVNIANVANANGETLEEVLDEDTENNNTDLPNDLCSTKSLTAGSAALLSSVFPHLAVIHQFALLNSDVKALELISQLGVHMQTQAADGAYKQLTLANSSNTNEEINGNIYGDIDDIVLIE